MVTYRDLGVRPFINASGTITTLGGSLMDADVLAAMREAAGAYRAIVAHLDEDAKADAWAGVRDCLADFEGKAGFETEIDLAIGAGGKPA